MKRHVKPAAVGGRGFGHFNAVWSELGVRTKTTRVVRQGLKALYGTKAAAAAIRKAEEISGKSYRY